MGEYYLTNNIKWIYGYEKWKGLKSIGLVIKIIENINTDKITEEQRHYIVSFKNIIIDFADAITNQYKNT